MEALRQAEAAIRESEEYFRFLNDLVEATRTLADPEQIMAVTARMLGAHLRVSRCAYADVEKDGERFTILHDYVDGCASTVGTYQLSLFGPRAVATLRSGQTLIIRSVQAELMPGEGADMFNAIGIKAIITCPLVKDGVLRAMMAVHQTVPRDWKGREIAVVQDVVDRCWATIERRTAEANIRRLNAELEQRVIERTAQLVELGNTNQSLRTEIAERERAERSLRESEERFHFVAHAVSDAVWDWDLPTNTIWRNDGHLSILGSADGDIKSDIDAWISRIHPDERGRVADSIRDAIDSDATFWNAEYRIQRKDGRDAVVEDRGYILRDSAGKAVRVVGGMRDITERKRLEEHLFQAQKMAALGQFSGGVAHDFNNVLSAIGGYTELALRGLKDNPGVRDDLRTVLQATSRAANLVAQIVSFSRQQSTERQVIRLQPVVAESLKLMRATIPSTIEFNTSIAMEAPAVLANANQVHQVLMNLGTNAWHAMKDRPGQLRVTLETIAVDAAYAAIVPQLRPGDYVRVSVSDAGHGMEQATLRRIFEPFFTTKPLGEGTGFGLAAVHGIMDSHDGAVTVHSAPDKGTEFRLYFPALADNPTAPGADAVPTPRGRGERVLVVDDEELLARMVQKTLVMLGYDVEIATQPSAAIEMVRADPGRFALVLTDQTMPRMTGQLLACELQKIRPGLPIILLTGHSLLLTSDLETAGIRQVLLKPTTLDGLGTAVHAAVSGQSTS